MAIHQQRIIPCKSRQIMAIGIPMPLRIHPCRILGINDSVRRLIRIFLNIIIQRIDHLTGINSARIVPDQAIINRSDFDPRLKDIIPTSQQRQFFLQQGSLLPLEREESRSNITIGIISRPNSDGRVGRISPGFVRDHHVQIIQISGRQ